MARPLKDIIAELEAKYEGSELKNDLMQRRLKIGSYQLHMEYLMMQMGRYEDEVKNTVEFNLSASIISRITLNLLIVMVRTYNRIPAYRDSLERYLLDEEYDENYKIWNEFDDKSKKIEDRISELQKNNIFAIDEIDKDSALQNHHIIQGFDGQVPPLVNFEQRLAYMNGGELLSCLQYMIDILRKEISDLKIIALLRDDDMMEEVYDLNYLLYAKRYWPEIQSTFRSHVSHQLLRNKVTISGLERLRYDVMHDFELHQETGRIWYYNSEDKKRLAIELKRKELNEDQWKDYFEYVFKIEEYDRWMYELEHPNIVETTYPISVLDKIFKGAIDVVKLKTIIPDLLSNEFTKPKLFVLHKVLDEIDWLQNSKGTDFLNWVKEVYAFDGLAKDFKSIDTRLKKSHTLEWKIDTLTSGAIALGYIDLANKIRKEFVIELDGKYVKKDNINYFLRPDLYIDHKKKY